MKRKLLFTLAALLLLGQMAMAQKIDQRLTDLVQNSAQHRAPAQQAYLKTASDRFSISLTPEGKIGSFGVMAYLRKGAQCPTEQLERNGITVNSVVDNIVSLSVPADKLMALEDIDDIILVLPDEYKQLTNNDGRRMTNADKVSDATAAVAEGLPQAYTGSGVVIGVIDDGIDFNHLAFLNPDGTTRLKMVYVYNKGAGINVSDYDPSEIPMVSYDVNTTSHGTHTSAIAAGSRMQDGWQGVAPDADLILVGVGKNSSDAVMYDAMKKIFDYAESVNKPAVINISMGNTTGLHDGSVPMAKYVKELTESGNKKGRAVVISSANAADNQMSIIKTLGDPDAEGWQIKTVMGAYIPGDDFIKPSYFKSDLFLYADDGKDFTAELRLVNIKTGEVISGNIDSYLTDGEFGRSGYKLIKGSRVNIKGESVVIWETEYNTPTTTLTQSDLRLALFVKGTKGQTIKIIRKDDDAQECGFMEPESLQGKGYVNGNGDIAFNVDICDDAVISVGSFISRMSFTNYEGENMDFTKVNSKVTGVPQVVGEISDFSSYGIDDNGKSRPTVLAPGQHVLSAFNLYDITKFDHFGNLDPTGSTATVVKNYEKNDRKNWFGYNMGTSMSAPHLTGIVALWMQAKPTLTVNEIKDVMKQTCINDQFTDIVLLPSHHQAQAGYGKIDALAGLKKILGIDTSIPGLPRELAQVKLVGRTLMLQGQKDAEVTVYNLSGEQVMTTRAQDGAVRLDGLASGVYAVKVGQQGSTLIRL